MHDRYYCSRHKSADSRRKLMNRLMIGLFGLHFALRAIAGNAGPSEAYYPFNGDALDESGNGNDGIPVGATLTSDRFGNPDSAYRFDGNDSIDCGNGDSINIEGSMTLAAWVKLDPVGAGSNIPEAFIGKFGSSPTGQDNQYVFGLQKRGLLCFQPFLHGQALNIVWENPNWQVNEWNHVAATYDASTDTAKLYFNGVLRNTKELRAEPFTTSVALSLGATAADGPKRYLNGSLDEVRIYESVLTEQEILDIMNPVDEQHMPDAQDDGLYASEEDGILTVAASNGVLANDSDPDGNDILIVSNFDRASQHGAAVRVNNDGSFEYDPSISNILNALSVGETLDDSFTYTASDGHGGADDATVTIRITGVNDVPEAQPDGLYASKEDGILAVAASNGVLANDSDPDGNDILIVSNFDRASQHGAAVRVNNDGSFEYDPSISNILNALSVGEALDDSFTYTASDGHGGADNATVTIGIAGVNDAPDVALLSIIDDADRMIGLEDFIFVSQNVTLTINFTDPDQSDSHSGAVEWGDGSLDSAGPIDTDFSFIIEKSQAYRTPGDYEVRVIVRDQEGSEGVATTTIHVVNAGLGLTILAEGLNDLLEQVSYSTSAAIQDGINAIIGQNKGDANDGATDKIDLGNFNAALVKIRDAIAKLAYAESTDDSLDLSHAKLSLSLAGAAVANQAVEEAIEISQSAIDLINEGRELIKAEHFLGSIELFRKALTHLKSSPKGKKSFTVNGVRLEITSVSDLPGIRILRLSISGPSGIVVELERSGNFLEWNNLRTVVIPDAGISELQIETESDSLSKFYRLRRIERNSR